MSRRAVQKSRQRRQRPTSAVCAATFDRAEWSATRSRASAAARPEFDPDPEAEQRKDAVMTMPGLWIKATDTDGNSIGPGYTYAVCNQCLDRQIGVLWNNDGTVARVWFSVDVDVSCPLRRVRPRPRAATTACRPALSRPA